VPGKLPIDRARAMKNAARPYEDNEQTFAERLIELQASKQQRRGGRARSERPDADAHEEECGA
jgi:hypothetical protein